MSAGVSGMASVGFQTPASVLVVTNSGPTKLRTFGPFTPRGPNAMLAPVIGPARPSAVMLNATPLGVSLKEPVARPGGGSGGTSWNDVMRASNSAPDPGTI